MLKPFKSNASSCRSLLLEVGVDRLIVHRHLGAVFGHFNKLFILVLLFSFTQVDGQSLGDPIFVEDFGKAGDFPGSESEWDDTDGSDPITYPPVWFRDIPLPYITSMDFFSPMSWDTDGPYTDASINKRNSGVAIPSSTPNYLVLPFPPEVSMGRWGPAFYDNGPFSIGGYSLVTDSRSYYQPYFRPGEDHTSGDSLGYMLLVDAHASTGTYFSRRVDSLCPGTELRFSAWIIDLNTQGSAAPGVTFSIYTVNASGGRGVLLASRNTGAIGPPGVWAEEFFDFTMPPGLDEVFVEVSNNVPTQYGNDLGIDDISIAAIGPPIEFVAFESVCVGTNPMLRARVESDPYPTNYFQLQMSSDPLGPFSNIGTPLSNSGTGFVNFPDPGVAEDFYYRVVVAGDTTTLRNPNCSVVSELLLVNVGNVMCSTFVNNNVDCFGENMGTATVIATEGSGGYSYLWDNGETTATATMLSAGLHTVTVTDSDSCSATCMDSVTILGPRDSLVAIVRGDTVECDDLMSGQVRVSAMGGVPPYQFLWSVNAGSSTDSVVNNLGPGTYSVIVTDDSLCTTTYEVEVALIDTTVPQIRCVEDTVLYGCDTSVLSAGRFMPIDTFDNCRVDSVWYKEEVYLSNCIDSIYRTWYVMDSSGNSDSCSHSLVIRDTVAPKLYCSGLVNTLYLGSDGVVLLDTGVVLDSVVEHCSGLDSVWLSRDTLGCADVGVVIDVRISARDSCLNESGCRVQILVLDTLMPMFSCKTDTLYLDMLGMGMIDSNDVVDLGMSACGIARVDLSRKEFDCGGLGEDSVVVVVRTLTGVVDSCVTKVLILDTLVPEISCLGDTLVYGCDTGALSAEHFMPVDTSDNCGVDSVWYEEEVYLSSCVDSIYRTWYVRDVSGNMDSCSQSLVVRDTTIPTITTPGDVVFYNCEVDVQDTMLTGAPLVSDDCGIDSVWYADVRGGGRCMDSTYRRWYVEDSCGNRDSVMQLIVVLDTTSPTLYCHDNIDTLYLGSDGLVLLDTGVVLDSVVEHCSGLDSVWLSRDTFGCADVGVAIDVRISARDSCLNESSCMVQILVLDTLVPMFSCKTDTLYLDMLGMGMIDSNDVVDLGMSACGIARVDLSREEFDCGGLGEDSVVVVVRTLTGVVDSCVAKVLILDTLVPEISCLGDTVVYGCDTGALSAEHFMPADTSDNCGVDSVWYEEEVYLSSCVDSIYRTWYVRDVSGNMDSCSQSLVVRDTVVPVISNIGDTLRVNCLDSIPDLPSVAIIENCGVLSYDTIVTLSDTGNVGPFLVVQTTKLVVTDRCGLKDSVQWRYEVPDTLRRTDTLIVVVNPSIGVIICYDSLLDIEQRSITSTIIVSDVSTNLLLNESIVGDSCFSFTAPSSAFGAVDTVCILSGYDYCGENIYDTTKIIVLVQPPSDTIYDTIIRSDSIRYCLEKQLPNGDSLRYCNSGNDNISEILLDSCVVLFGEDIGLDTICLVSCDHHYEFLCDTTYFIITVLPNVSIADPCNCGDPLNYSAGSSYFFRERVLVRSNQTGLSLFIDTSVSVEVYDDAAMPASEIQLVEVDSGLYEADVWVRRQQNYTIAVRTVDSLIGMTSGFCDDVCIRANPNCVASLNVGCGSKIEVGDLLTFGSNGFENVFRVEIKDEYGRQYSNPLPSEFVGTLWAHLVNDVTGIGCETEIVVSNKGTCVVRNTLDTMVWCVDNFLAVDPDGDYYRESLELRPYVVEHCTYDTFDVSYEGEWVIPYECGDTLQLIVREWRGVTKAGNSCSAYDSIYVIRLPNLNNYLYAPQKDTLSCVLDTIYEYEFDYVYTSWKQLVGIHSDTTILKYPFDHSHHRDITGVYEAWESITNRELKDSMAILLMNEPLVKRRLGLGNYVYYDLFDVYGDTTGLFSLDTIDGQVYRCFGVVAGDQILTDGGAYLTVDDNWFYEKYDHAFWVDLSIPYIDVELTEVVCDKWLTPTVLRDGEEVECMGVQVILPNHPLTPDTCYVYCLDELAGANSCLEVVHVEDKGLGGSCPRVVKRHTLIKQSCVAENVADLASLGALCPIDTNTTGVVDTMTFGGGCMLEIEQWLMYVDTLAPLLRPFKEKHLKYTTSDHDCYAEVVLPSIEVKDVCSGVKSVKATLNEALGWVVYEDADGDGEWTAVPGRTQRVACSPDSMRVHYELMDSCHNVLALDTNWISVVDHVSPLVILDDTLTLALGGKEAWVEAEVFDNGSTDNCGVVRQLVRRLDWATACGVDLCPSTRLGAAFEGITNMRELNAYLSRYGITGLVDNEVEAYYARQFEWLAENAQWCHGDNNIDLKSLLLAGWRDDVINAWAAEGCLPTDDHGNLLVEVEDDVFSLGGGWGDKVPFCCEDVCQSITVEILTIDKNCNYTKGWSVINVEDNSVVTQACEFEEITIGCSSYQTNYAAAVAGAESGDADALAALDDLFGPLVKGWAPQDGPIGEVIVDFDGNELDKRVTYYTSTCRLVPVERRVLDTLHDGTVSWETITETRAVEYFDTIEADLGGIYMRCGAECVPSVWVELNECGVGKITRRWEVYGGCTSTSSAQAASTSSAQAGTTGSEAGMDRGSPLIIEQVIYVTSDCELNKYALEVPNDGLVCGELTYALDGNVDVDAGQVRYVLGDAACRQMGISYYDEVFSVVGDASLFKIHRTWRVNDWCNNEEEVCLQKIVLNTMCAEDSRAISEGVLTSKSTSEGTLPTGQAGAKAEGLNDLARSLSVEQEKFELYQNTPNPFVEESVIRFRLPEAGVATLTLFDMSGRVLYELEGEYKAGVHEVLIISDQLSDRDVNGVLFYQLETSTNSATKQMLILR